MTRNCCKPNSGMRTNVALKAFLKCDKTVCVKLLTGIFHVRKCICIHFVEEHTSPTVQRFINKNIDTVICF